MNQPLVHMHKTVLMQRLLDAVCHGYYWHTHGTVSVPKALRLAEKFSECYGVHRNANSRAYAKRMGQSNAKLFLYAASGTEHLSWWLLATNGDGSVHREEDLASATDARRRLRIGDNDELVRRTRPRGHGGGTVWTWRMTTECVREWRERIIMACRRREAGAVTQTVGSLYRCPGFSGIRHQVGKLVALSRKEWRRRHGNLNHFILPPALPYLERLRDTAIPLSELVERSDE